MSLVVKFIALILLLISSKFATARDIYILTLGDSLASNCNEHAYPAQNSVFTLHQNGILEIARNPLMLKNCYRGSIWLPLGKELIASKMANRVIFFNIEKPNASIDQWLPNGEMWPNIEAAMSLAQKQGFKFDYALWLQGASDVHRTSSTYPLAKVLKLISLQIPIEKWIIARFSACYGQSNPVIERTQVHVIEGGGLLRRFAGPNINELDKRYKTDGCYLNQSGQEKVASLWLESMTRADRRNSEVQSESLLGLFRSL